MRGPLAQLTVFWFFYSWVLRNLVNLVEVLALESSELHFESDVSAEYTRHR